MRAERERVISSRRGFAEEFETVLLLTRSNLNTRGVDAFALAFLKAERQMRRLFTHLVYQSSALGEADTFSLIRALADRRDVFFRHFRLGIEELSGTKISVMVGGEYERLNQRLEKATEVRHKIFHGQLTNRSLMRTDLLGYVDDIQCWCEQLSSGAQREIGYDGFSEETSFHKSANTQIAERVSRKIGDIEAYRRFLADLIK